MLELTDYSIVVGGDMNVVWDRSNPNASRNQVKATIALQSWVKNVGLIDINGDQLKIILFFHVDTNHSP